MQRLSGVSAAVGFMLLCSPGTGHAQEFTADEVASFFAADLQKTRGICVGSDEECAEKLAPAPFDMLVTFELNSDQLTPEAQANLKEMAGALADDRLRDAKFLVEGHTDALGAEAYNDKLSERRALRVAEFLVAQGVAADRLTSLGLGEGNPRTEDPFDPLNRRVEMKLTIQ
jgi:outer membrane protein OmpA-like peptidoglycan-associated protein